ncbi:MAG: hypothetical protein M2R46_05618 [Verrucomicrobia subdivision 3 bacterium]|nr:hypothetical protein [Limisphaerales bacterium]
MVVRKTGNDAYPYKLAAANQEDCRCLSPQWSHHPAAAPGGIQRDAEGTLTDKPHSKAILRALFILLPSAQHRFKVSNQRTHLPFVNTAH